MSMKRRLLAIINNPLVLIPPLVIVLVFGWQHYTYAGRDFNLPDATNVFPDSMLTTFSPSGLPAGWHARSSGSLRYTTTPADGYAAGQSLKVTLSSYHDGTLTITTPKIAVQPHTTYLFKNYYRSSTSFSLLIRQSSTANPGQLRLADTYSNSGTSWTSSSTTFTTSGDDTTVQFTYRLYGNGQLLLNLPYLEPRNDIRLEPSASGQNTIPNPLLATTMFNQPNDWSTYQAGDNTAIFSYNHDGSGAFLDTTVANYRSGEAKWQYAAQPVNGHQYYQFSMAYRSTARVPLTAEYVLADGMRQDQTVADLTPAEDWTTVTYHLETPPTVTSLFVELPLQKNGTVSSRNYQLINATRAGAPAWKQPIVSITFDDGWKLSYDNALPLLKQLNYKATFYINPASIETPGFMSANDLAALSSSGNEIGAHGYEHEDLTAINAAALDYQLHQGRDYLRQAGFSVSDLATPYGRSDPQVAWYARKYFTTLRSTETGVNTRQNFDPYNLKVLYINDFTSPQTLSDMLRQTKDNNGWLILVYHRIGNDLEQVQSLPVESSTATTQQFREQLDLIHKSNIAVMPVAAAYTRLEQQ
jgi:peptidoglycan/xylan/chitin deacetylase (PgdA/CDA1 family)